MLLYQVSVVVSYLYLHKRAQHYNIGGKNCFIFKSWNTLSTKEFARRHAQT